MIHLIENSDLTDYIAVIPSVSVGNVGQLVSDLLISSFNLKKLGYVWHSQLLPFAGADPFEKSDMLTTACELFYSQSLKLVVFQIRSAFTKDKNGILQEWCEWLKSRRVKQVIILAGVSAHERRDTQLVGEPVRYVFCPLTESREGKNAKSRKWIELENKESSSDEICSYIPGAGIAVKLFRICVKEKIPCSILLEFCSEGNNVPDAWKLMDYLDEWLQLKEKVKIDNWIIPPSWKHLFGPLPPVEIFN